jgi:hypothetical protein
MSHASAHQISAARKLLPILDCIPTYRCEWFLPDTVATTGGLYAWEFEKSGRELKVRVV